MNPETLIAVIVELLAKSVSIAALALLLPVIWRRSTAAQRHLSGVVALVTVAMLPLSRLVPPRWAIPIQPRQKVMLSVSALPLKSMEVVEVEARPREVKTASAPMVPIDWRRIVLGVWFAGTTLILGHRLLGSWRLRRLRRRAFVVEDPRVNALLSETLGEMGIRRRLEIRLSAECRVPITWGIFRPVMLLPVEALGWSDTWLRAALRHESAHIWRHDHLTRWVAQVACALYWPNPLMWLLARSLRLTQEQAADDLVLRAGTPADEYATQLVEAARTVVMHGFFVRQAVAMACPSTLEARVKAIVDGRRDRRPLGRLAAGLGSLVVALVLALCTAAQLVGAGEAAGEKPGGATAEAAIGERPRAPGPQIVIWAKIVEVPANADSSVNTTDQAKFSGPQFQGVMRALEQIKGVETLAAPRLVTRAGQRAAIETVREFRYPVAWEKDAAAGGWKPAKFETRNMGVTVEMTPELQADGGIVIHARPSLVEFLGFVNLDNDRSVAMRNTRPGDFTDVPDISQLEPGGSRVKPVFSERSADETVTLKSGETVAFADLKETSDVRPFDKGEPPPKLIVFITASVLGEPPAEKPAGESQPKSEPNENAGNPPTTGNELMTKEWKIPGDLIPAKPGGDGGERQSTKDWLVAHGVKFAGGASAIYITLSSRLIVRNTPEQLEIVDRLVTAGTAPASAEKAAPAAEAPGAPGTPADAFPTVAKAKQIIIPRIEMREATLDDVLAFLRKQAAEVDPDKAGVKLTLKPGTVTNARITVSLTNVPLLEAMRYVTGLTNLKLTIRRDELVVEPLNDEKKSDSGTTDPVKTGGPDGAEQGRDKARVEMVADSTQFTGTMALAKGHASFTYSGQTIRADEIRYDIATREVDLTGNVEIKNGASLLQAERVTLSLKPGGQMKSLGPNKVNILAPPGAPPKSDKLPSPKLAPQG